MASTVIGLIDCAISNLSGMPNMQAQLSIGLLNQFKALHKDGFDDDDDLDEIMSKDNNAENYKLNVDFSKICSF